MSKRSSRDEREAISLSKYPVFDRKAGGEERREICPWDVRVKGFVCVRVRWRLPVVSLCTVSPMGGVASLCDDSGADDNGSNRDGDFEAAAEERGGAVAGPARGRRGTCRRARGP